MKLSKLLLTSTTALGLSMTAAIADSNESFVKQDGTDNTALIEQGGEFNRAGRGLNNQSILQNGNNNEIDVDQSGDLNAVGVQAGADAPAVLGIFRQDGAYNKATITQGGDDNLIREIDQGTNPGYTSTRNTLSVDQSGDGNSIRRIEQETDVPGKPGNVADIDMSGNDNFIALVSQRSDLSNGEGGATATNGGNTITVSMSGSNNGSDNGLTGLSNVTTSGVLFQEGRANDINLNISGSNNEFGVSQTGSVGGRSAGATNSVGVLDIAGDNNQVGIDQFGFGNTVQLASIAVGSDGNIIGITQTGNTNNASASVDGDDNEFGIKQDGASNSADVSITGDLNGVPGVPFSGDADSVLTANTTMASGLFQQMGDENSVIVDVIGDSNAFATLQNNETLGAGVGNTINGTIDGSGNQVAIAQIGGNNTTSFSQIGSGNNLGVSQ